VAQYRTGHYKEALTTLSKSHEVNARRPSVQASDLAFLAMTRHQLGQTEEAAALLPRLREAVSRAGSADGRAFLREAEALIAGPSKADR
jgi:hypothetical protein